MSLATVIRNFKNSTSIRVVAIAVIAALFMPVGVSFASETDDFIDAITGGKPTFNFRSRMEIADADGLDQSTAFTARLRIGYGTAAYHGFSVYADMEHIGAASERKYWGKTDPNIYGRTAIADPEDTQLNQAYLKFQSDDLGFSVTGGRQRLILDDARFVGNVGWRQNEQTFDAVTLKGSFGVEDLEVLYSYVWDVRRIFGNQGSLEGSRDFDSDSHFINASYSGLPFGKVTAFAYLLDFNKTAAAKGNSSNTFGFRFAGDHDFSDNVNLGYQASYAYQEDGGGNPLDYESHYALADVNLTCKCAGKVGFGFELQDSDHGKGSFTTPLATLHKFNGFADVFLTSNSTMGLRDYYVYVAPKLPFGLKGKFIYHHFDSDSGSPDTLGNEYDAVLSRGFWKNRFTVLSKVAVFEGSHGKADISRYWLEATLAF